jgi:hypothetical protein
MFIEDQIMQLCKELCDRYEFCSEGYRMQVAAAIGVLKPLCGEERREQLDELLADAVEDARTGRGDAEVENFIRDAKQRRADAAAKQNTDDQPN